ncbi:hypothetical protein [Spirosoma validum]|uniref:Uncharacterized protein n=1 Tax=Spirosoma validum TaxID=2771355 RepID=A0A927AZX0_9BACT|nr:hypothetical protein [Spirosoma validum]MBD2752960.1 hypothetical protein [Spirosoma validum]
MTIIFNYLFTPTNEGFKTRLPVCIQKGPLLPKGLDLTVANLNGLDIDQWVGKNLEVTIQEGTYMISGPVGQ